MAIHTYNKSEERGQFSAHVQDVNGNIIWEVNYPEFYEDDSTGELIESTTIFDDGFMKNTDDIEGLESYLKSMGTLKSEDELVSFKMADDGYMAHGGSVEQGNIDMIKNQVVQVEHHANELKQTLKSNPQVDAWVVAKMDRATSNLSDITHYLEGEQNSFADGGYMAEGGELTRGEIDNQIEGLKLRIAKTKKTLSAYENTNRGKYHKLWKEKVVPLQDKLSELSELWGKSKYADGGYMDNGGAMPYGENKSYYKEGDIFTIENTRNAIIITKIDWCVKW
jgi:hypothetical protein